MPGAPIHGLQIGWHNLRRKIWMTWRGRNCVTFDRPMIVPAKCLLGWRQKLRVSPASLKVSGRRRAP